MNMKKILSVVLCFVMLLSLPGMAFAVDEALSSGDTNTSEHTGEGSNASTSDHTNDSSNTSGDQDTTSDGEKESVSGSDNVGDGDHSDATNGTTIVEPETPKADAPGTDDAKEDKGDADQDSDATKGDANPSDDGKNDTNHEDSDQEDAAQEEDKKDDTSKDEIADEEDAVNQEEEAGEEAPEITYPAIEETIEDEDSGINVVVNAPEGAFPEGTTVSILPIHQLAGEEAVSEETEIPAAITNILGDINEKTGDELVQELTEAIQQSVAEAMREEPVELQQMVAFDITFTCDGKEVQPAAGYKVDVKFEVANESDLVDMEAPDQQLQVFHVETDDKGETKASPLEDAIVVDPTLDAQKVEIEAENFSFYVVAGLLNAVNYVVDGTLSIDSNTIKLNGCLTPKWEQNPEDKVTYQWSRSASEKGKYEEVTGNSLQHDGVNVALDDGGMKWYQVTAFNSEGFEIATSAPYWVPYSNQIENGSFEMPDLSASNPNNFNRQFNQNDKKIAVTPENVAAEQALWWRTTGPGPGKRDIEVVACDTTKKPTQANPSFSTNKAPDGQQYAEINCEAAGALYQDVLTIPGEKLNWSLFHHARKGTDKMAVVIMPAAEAEKYTTQAQLIDIVNGKTNVKGARVYGDLTATTKEWVTHGGTYNVENDNQYLTRFFFVAVSTGSNQKTVGNLIDMVRFSTDVGYTIEYWVNGQFVEEKTEKDIATVGSTISAKHAEEFLKQGFVLERTTLDEADHNKQTSFTVSEYQPNVLRLYFVSTGVTVTKQVSLLDSTPEEAAALVNGYQATFALQDSGKTVAEAKVTISDGTTGSSLFMTSKDGKEEKFIPDPAKTYQVVETAPTSTVEGYDFVRITNLDGKDLTNGNTQTVMMNGKLAADVTFVNEYEKHVEDYSLTITKEVNGDLIDPNQTFIFKVTSDEDKEFHLTVTVQGAGKVKITGLKAGTYIVTEDQNWSWRYEAAQGGADTVTLSKENPDGTVKITNNLKKTNWLSGGSFAVNTWTDKGITPTLSPKKP